MSMVLIEKETYVLYLQTFGEFICQATSRAKVGNNLKI